MDISRKRKLHIAFAYPYGNGFHPSWVESLTGLLLHEVNKEPKKRVLGSVLKHGSCYVDMNRSAIGQILVDKTRDDWVMMVDTDVAFQSTILEQFADLILKNPKARIIAGRVNLGNGMPVFYKNGVKGPKHQPFAFE